MSAPAISLASSFANSILEGVPFDYIDTPVFDPQHRELLVRREVLQCVIEDRNPLPTTEAREGYFGPRHLEYWLSGYRDAQRVVSATKVAGRPDLRILDFGGATGRVVRHFSVWCPNASLFLSDMNERHIAVAQSLFKGKVCAFRNRSTPSLPFPDGFLDLAVAFSVFTHIDADDTAWLLELRRIIKPGGYLYLTVHDEATWERLDTLVPMNPAFAAPELVEIRKQNPILTEKIVHFYNPNQDYGCNTFLSKSYIEQVWGPLFQSMETMSWKHDHQASVVFQV